MKKYMSFAGYLLLVANMAYGALRPIPWVTHDAVCFLDDFMKNNPNASILEFGSGASTIWFAQITQNLVSIEHSPQWATEVKNLLKEKNCFAVNYILHPTPYYTLCNRFKNESFDLILVDGRNRSGCIKHSIPLLKRGGIMMIDNAERSWYQKGLNLLKNWKSYKTVQNKPDTCGFFYTNWQTHWYIKP